jgi:hypothetical protein
MFQPKNEQILNNLQDIKKITFCNPENPGIIKT